MPITPAEREQVVTELKRFAKDLNLDEQQKERIQTALVEAREKITEYLKKNPNMPKTEIIAKVMEHREEIRQRIAGFLTTEQLAKWVAEVAKAKEFLGQKLEV